MLEGRKLSLEMQRDSNSRVWTLLSFLIGIGCVLLLASLWIGLSIAPPAPDKSQDNMAQAHAKVLEGVDQLKSSLAADQALTPELFTAIAEWIPVLDGFAQASAKATQTAADSRDAQIWPGRANLILDDLNTLILAKEPTLNLMRTRDSLSALYKPKGPVSPQASVPLSAFREFNTGVAEWVKLTTPNASSSVSASAAKPPAISAPITWSFVASSKVPLRQINAQMDALEGETKLTDSANAAQAKAAQTLLTALNANNLMQSLRSTDEQMSKVWAAHERLLALARAAATGAQSDCAASTFFLVSIGLSRQCGRGPDGCHGPFGHWSFGAVGNAHFWPAAFETHVAKMARSHAAIRKYIARRHATFGYFNYPTRRTHCRIQPLA
jgi:hypothetical protein